MRFYIKVDHSQLKKTADIIDDYIRDHNRLMSQADNEIAMLAVHWKGSDSNQFKNQWQKINASDSTSKQLLKALSNYADLLRFAANKYRTAQANAINRANRLPKW